MINCRIGYIALATLYGRRKKRKLLYKVYLTQIAAKTVPHFKLPECYRICQFTLLETGEIVKVT